MNNNYTHASILIDKSGSMGGSEKDVIGGINKFIEEQRKVPGKLTISLVQFDSEYEQMYDFVDINDVKLLDDSSYIPRGWTRLRDATGRLINETGARLAALPEAVRPSKVVFLVFTDGGENSSREWSKQRLDNTIKEQKEKYSWDFIFLGADLSQAEAVQSYGSHLSASPTSASISKSRTGQAYNMVSSKMSVYRGMSGSGGSSGAGAALNFTAQEVESLNEGAGDGTNANGGAGSFADITGKTGAQGVCAGSN